MVSAVPTRNDLSESFAKGEVRHGVYNRINEAVTVAKPKEELKDNIWQLATSTDGRCKQERDKEGEKDKKK